MNRLPSIANLNLMSPPETKPLDEFKSSPLTLPIELQTPTYTPEKALSSMATRKPSSDQTMRVLPSPPVSPWMDKQNKSGKTASKSGDAFIEDPPLYDDADSFDSSSQPLFPIETAKTTGDLIDRHIAMHMVQFKNKLNRPTREEYRLALSCIPVVGAAYNRNPGQYMKRQREEAEDYYWQTKRIRANPMTRAEREAQLSKAAPIAIAPAPKTGKRAMKLAIQKASPGPRIKRTPKASPLAKLMNYPAKGRSSETPERMPGTKREDVDYASLPDYSPPASTLPHNPKALKADWPSNNILDLSTDPDRHMLHEAEVNLAATLRLTCATYLCSKRRIFDARLTALRIGKEFRKTDAQQACKIDVNKASKLWTAYDKVGWFQPEYFRQHLKVQAP